MADDSIIQMTQIDELPIAGRKVLIRVDFNCPIEGDRVADDSRIRAALPTIQYALAEGAACILVSHLGRPKGKADPKYSLVPVGERLAELLDQDVMLTDAPVGESATRLARELRAGEVLLPRTSDTILARPRMTTVWRATWQPLQIATSTMPLGRRIGRRQHSRCGTADAERAADGRKEVCPSVFWYLRDWDSWPYQVKVSDKIGVIENLLARVERILI